MILSVGEFIKFFRKSRKMSQGRLAEVLGCTAKGLSKIENGLTSPRAYTVKLFEDYFKVKLSRYYQGNDDGITLASGEMLVKMMGERGDIKAAYKSACEFESDKYVKNDECRLGIWFVKAQFYLGAADDAREAIRCCAEGLKYEAYVYFDESGDAPIKVESFMPSIFGCQMIILLGYCYTVSGEHAKAAAVYEELLKTVDGFFAEPNSVIISYGKDDAYIAHSALSNNLAHTYYDLGRYGEIPPLVERALRTTHKFSNGNSEAFARELHYINFKALCALKRYDEAIETLPRLLFRGGSERRCAEMRAEFTETFPEIAQTVNGAFSLYDALTGLCAPRPKR